MEGRLDLVAMRVEGWSQCVMAARRAYMEVDRQVTGLLLSAVAGPAGGVQEEN